MGLAPATHRRTPPAHSLRPSQAKDLLCQMVREAPVAFVQADADGRMNELSAWWCEMLQDSAAQLFGRKLQEVIHPEDWPRTEAALRGMAKGGPNFSLEQRCLRRDGSVLWTCASVMALRGPDGAYQGLAAMVLDVSDRKHQEIELQRRNRELLQADQRKSEFLATLAHELRNPLAPLSQALHMLQSAPQDLETVQQSSEVMARQVHHLTRLVDELLDISRIAQGKMTLQRDTVALRDVAQAAIDLSSPLIRQHRHRLELRLPEAPVYLYADPVRLAQVLGNLLNNAAKYTPDGGRIDVEARICGQSVRLSVRDNGVGISSEDLPHIFDLFTQVGRSLEMAQGGLGIGLSLSRQLVELHGGRIRVDSDGIGRGAVFTVELPTCPPPERPRPCETRSQTPAEQPLRLLVVDDNADGANTLAAILQMSGHATAVAYDGASALAQARSLLPQVALLDLRMPGMDGFELARQLKAQLPELALMAVTGWASEADRQRSQAAGFDAHLTKPVDIAAIDAALQRIAHRRTQSRQG